ncbi:MAG: energy-coupling factor ABC transporter permease [Gammaproteobacteria bacterium]|nr:energy-coupling factor ABC transporter permease [Gammaproteobacteria bacterium]MDH3448116.1 energy-coupling factor ABC transporter permease [Gammaproteobacteria bacterium]
MDIPGALFPGFYLWTGGAVYAMLMLVALSTAPWAKIRDNEAQHIFLGATVAVCLLWVMRGGIQEGLSFHLLGMTLLCLMFEWQFALVAASLVVAMMTLQGPAGWEAFGLNVLLMGALPILFTRIFLYLCQRRLPHNYYIYVFLNAFLGGGLSILLAGAASAWLQHVADVQPTGSIARNFLQILPLLMFGEAFINGGAMTLLVAYRPRWVATFHDSWYVSNK